MDRASEVDAVRIRREPPRFRRVVVDAVEDRTDRLRRLTLRGDLADYEPALPAASVRLLLPHDGELALPTWNGNEFLRGDGTRPVIRTLTPLAFDRASRTLAVEVVRHGAGPLSAWADEAKVGEPVALSGPGRGYDVDDRARAFLLAGDESALPAIGDLLPHLPAAAVVSVLVEADRRGRPELLAPVTWITPADAPGRALAAAVARTAIPDGTRVWAAGEAASMQQIRTHLLRDKGLDRGRCTVRGYWKVARGFRAPTDGEARR